MDWDKNGVVSAVEFKSYLANVKKGEEMTLDEALKAFREIDTNGSKNIEWEEFLVRKIRNFSTSSEDSYLLNNFNSNRMVDFQKAKKQNDGLYLNP